MGVSYYGVLYEDKDVAVLMKLSGHPFDLEEYEEAADSLLKLFEEGEELLEDIGDENVFSVRALYALTRVAELARRVALPNYPPAVLYLAICKYFNMTPKILSDLTLTENYKKKTYIIPP